MFPIKKTEELNLQIASRMERELKIHGSKNITNDSLSINDHCILTCESTFIIQSYYLEISLIENSHTNQFVTEDKKNNQSKAGWGQPYTRIYLQLNGEEKKKLTTHPITSINDKNNIETFKMHIARFDIKYLGALTLW